MTNFYDFKFLSFLWDRLTEQTVRFPLATDLESHQQILRNMHVLPVWNIRTNQRKWSQPKYLYVALRWSTDEAVLGRIHSQCFDWRVVGLEALPLEPVGKLQDADPALPPACDKQLLPGGHGEHGSTGLVAAESWGEREREIYIQENMMDRSKGMGWNWETH